MRRRFGVGLTRGDRGSGRLPSMTLENSNAPSVSSMYTCGGDRVFVETTSRFSGSALACTGEDLVLGRVKFAALADPSTLPLDVMRLALAVAVSTGGIESLRNSNGIRLPGAGTSDEGELLRKDGLLLYDSFGSDGCTSSFPSTVSSVVSSSARSATRKE